MYTSDNIILICMNRQASWARVEIVKTPENKRCGLMLPRLIDSRWGVRVAWLDRQGALILIRQVTHPSSITVVKRPPMTSQYIPLDDGRMISTFGERPQYDAFYPDFRTRRICMTIYIRKKALYPFHHIPSILICWCIYEDVRESVFNFEYSELTYLNFYDTGQNGQKGQPFIVVYVSSFIWYPGFYFFSFNIIFIPCHYYQLKNQ